VSIDVIGRWLKELIIAKLIRRTRGGPGRNAECEFIWNASLGTGDDSADLRNQDTSKTENQSQNQKAEPAAGAIGVCLTSEERLVAKASALGKNDPVACG
jgi:hypothetical protein